MMRYNRSHMNDTSSCTRSTSCERSNGCPSCNRRESRTACERNQERENRCRAAQCAANVRRESQSTCEGEQLLALIRRLDFALVEINLYLDTHPYSRTALNYFERLLHERNQAAERYEATVGPLTAMGNGTRDEWAWSTGEWPWQIDKESKR